MILDRDPRCDQIKSVSVDFDEIYVIGELAAEVKAIADNYKSGNKRYGRAFKHMGR